MRHFDKMPATLLVHTKKGNKGKSYPISLVLSSPQTGIITEVQTNYSDILTCCFSNVIILYFLGVLQGN